MMVSVDGVEFSYKSKKILDDVKFDVKKGDIVSILGVNGAGKSTLLKCINRILMPKKGTIMIDKFDLNKMDLLEMAKKIGYVPQRSDGSFMTVFDAMLLGRKPHVKWEISKKDIEITSEVLKLLGMEEFAFRNTNELSGGELQKVIIGRALVQEPRVILLDEPTNNLDIKNQYEVMKIIKDISRTQEITAIIVMHDINLALRYSDRFLMLKNGALYAEGGPEVINPDNILEVYGIRTEIHRVNGVKILVHMENI